MCTLRQEPYAWKKGLPSQRPRVKCRKCFVKGHYPAKCRSKKTLWRLKEEEGCHIGCHHNGPAWKESEIKLDNPSQLSGTPRPWQANIKVNGKKVNNRVDTPEPMSKWPQADTSPPNSPLIQKSNKKLFGPGKTEIDVSGHFPATLETDHTKTKQTSS